MNEKKLRANRTNARKSTGPKTPAGRIASSQNAVKHGLLSTAPVLPGIESPEAWEEHRMGIVNSLAPVGYMENFLAERIALLAWRLRRVVRYEVEVATASAATAEMDMEAQAEPRKPEDPAESRERAGAYSKMVQLLEALPGMPADEKLDSVAASATLWACNDELPEDHDVVSVPGVPDDDDAFDRFDDWTVGLLREAIELYAAASDLTPAALLNAAIQAFRKETEEAQEKEQRLLKAHQQWKLRLDRKLRGLMLLEPDVLEKVARYESGLERSLFKNLHELQRLQAARSGVAVTPPAAVDVDVTVNHEPVS